MKCVPTAQPRPVRSRPWRVAVWGWRTVVALALANLTWDVADWTDRRSATGERQFFRGAERPDAIDYGLVDLRIVNETDRDWVVNQVNVDNWGGPRFAGPPRDDDEFLFRAGQQGASRVERRYLDHLLAQGFIRLTDLKTGEGRTIAFAVDRRRPISCTVEVRIGMADAAVSGCEHLRAHRAADRWLFGPPDY